MVHTRGGCTRRERGALQTFYRRAGAVKQEEKGRKIDRERENSCGKFDTHIHIVYIWLILCGVEGCKRTSFEILSGKIVVDVIFARYKIYNNNYGNGTGIEFLKLYIHINHTFFCVVPVCAHIFSLKIVQ